MKLLAALLWLASCGLGQTLSVTASPTTISPGGTVTLHISYSTAAPDVAGLQWSLSLPAGVTLTTIAGAADAAAGKTLACRTDGTICLVYGINQTLIGSGEVAIYTVTFPPSIPGGTYNFSLSGLLGVTSAGGPLSVLAGPASSVVLLSRYDLNSDGVVNATDVALAVGQALGVCGTADVNSDGKCNIVDVMAVILKALEF